VHAERAQQNRDGKLALPVDTHIQQVVRVELELDPRSAIRDDSCAVQNPGAGRSLLLLNVKNTPGERCIWLTITRSVPLMMNLPLSPMRM
jgi:hypothetical protein